MKAIDVHTTLGDVVNDHPALARELERRGLDDGRRRLRGSGRRPREGSGAAHGARTATAPSRRWRFGIESGVFTALPRARCGATYAPSGDSRL